MKNDYPQPFKYFGKAVMGCLFAAWLMALLWDEGWWVVIAWVLVFSALDDINRWLKEIDKARYSEMARR